MKTSARAGTTLFSASPVVRFLLEAAFLVAVGVGAAFLRLSALAIALVMGLAWIAVALVERAAAASKLARASAAREPVPETTPTLEDLLAEPSPPKLEEEPASPEPEPVAAPSQAEPTARFRWRGEARSRRAPARPTPAQAPREWNLWELERRARELGGTNGMPEEWGALFRSLREFASPNGELPSEFDALVRESFPELIGAGS